MELNTILLATDGSPECEIALHAACDIAGGTGATLHLVHAWKVGTWAALYRSYPSVPTAAESAQTEAQELLREQQLRAEEHLGRPVVVHTSAKGPVRAIHDLALVVDADLLVVGGRMSGPIQRLFTERVSEWVLEYGGRPTLVLHGDSGPWPPSLVVACDDETAEAELATSLGAHIAKALGIGFHVVEIVRAHPGESEADLEKDLYQHIAELAAGEDVGVTTEVAKGRSRKTLLRVAREHPGALLALGMHGRREPSRAGGETTALHVLREVKGPVLIVPEVALHRAVSLQGDGRGRVRR
jgi:nucleotide-binding universal stress UspA family protein